MGPGARVARYQAIIGRDTGGTKGAGEDGGWRMEDSAGGSAPSSILDLPFSSSRVTGPRRVKPFRSCRSGKPWRSLSPGTFGYLGRRDGSGRPGRPMKPVWDTHTNPV